MISFLFQKYNNQLERIISEVGRDRWARRSAIRTDGPAVRPYPQTNQILFNRKVEPDVPIGLVPVRSKTSPLGTTGSAFRLHC
jgi:hypothetical protein